MLLGTAAADDAELEAGSATTHFPPVLKSCRVAVVWGHQLGDTSKHLPPPSPTHRLNLKLNPINSLNRFFAKFSLLFLFGHTVIFYNSISIFNYMISWFLRDYFQ